MASLQRKSWFRRVGKAIFALTIVGMSLIYWDFSRFSSQCESFSTLARTPKLPATVSQHEAIVVLTGDKGRIPEAIRLLRKRQSPWLVISGVGKGASLVDVLNTQKDPDTDIHAHWNKIISESKSQSTIENAIETKKILDEKKISQAILVTSDYHMPRALELFSILLPKTLIVPYPVLSDISHNDSARSSFFSKWALLIGEYPKKRIFDWYHAKLMRRTTTF